MKEVLRMCIVCKEMKDKSNLIRVVKTKDNNIEIDLSGKLDGRGAYICNNDECLSKLNKSKALNKAFKMQVSEEIYNQINLRSFNGRE